MELLNIMQLLQDIICVNMWMVIVLQHIITQHRKDILGLYFVWQRFTLTMLKQCIIIMETLLQKEIWV